MKNTVNSTYKLVTVPNSGEPKTDTNQIDTSAWSGNTPAKRRQMPKPNKA